MKPFIYALVDPCEPNYYRYIGMSMVSRRRPYVHARLARRKKIHHTHVTHWIQQLHRDGREYNVLILEEFDTDTEISIVRAAERNHIKTAKTAGFQLTNQTEGGEGILGFRHSDQFKKTRQQLMIGNQLSRGISPSKATREIKRLRMLGNKHLSGHKHSVTTKALISQHGRGKKRSDAIRKRMSEKLIGNTRALGYKNTTEQLAHRSAAHLGKTASGTSKVNMSAGQKRRYSKEENHIQLSRAQELRGAAEAGIILAPGEVYLSDSQVSPAERTRRQLTRLERKLAKLTEAQ